MLSPSIDKMKKLLFLLNILILSVLTSCVDKEGEPNNQEYFDIDYSTVGNENGYEYVDLGLSVKWATCNLGATSPDKIGKFYAWGEVTPKSRYSLKNYKWYDSDATDSREEILKYDCGAKHYGYDGRSILELQDDAANRQLGGNWRVPTPSELQELIDNCTWEFGAIRTFSGEQEGAQYGYKVTSKINGNSIFIPNSGNFKEYWVANSDIYLWSCAKNDTCTYRFDDRDELNAYSLYANRDSVSIVENTRDLGFAIRPVLPSTLDYSVKFDSNGADGNMSSLSVKHGELFVAPDAAYKCRGFVSWNTKPEANGKTYKIGDRFSISSNIELYAQWVRLSCESWTDANGYEYVDLGLSVKWATCNLGASSPEELGDKYAWGEVQTKQEFTWNNYQLCVNGDYTKLTKYCPKDYWLYDNFSESVIDNKTQLEFEDDAARVHLGGTWAVPSDSEINELIDPNNCVWIKSHRNNVAGYEVISKINGNSIFIPFMDKFDNGEGVGIYWASTITFTQHPEMGYALYLREDKNIGTWGAWDRYLGWYIRPVLL